MSKSETFTFSDALSKRALVLNRGGYPKPGDCDRCKQPLVPHKNNPVEYCKPCKVLATADSVRRSKAKARRRKAAK